MGPRIKQARKEAGLTQEALAEAIGVVVPIVKDYESGRKKPGRDRVPVLASVLSKPIAYFFDDAPPAEPRPDRLPETAPSERSLMEMLAKQQDLLTQQQSMMNEQQAMLERQRQDVARLTELLARQQEIFISERQFTQKLAGRQAEKQAAEIADLRAELDALKRSPRGRTQLSGPPGEPGLAGGH